MNTFDFAKKLIRKGKIDIIAWSLTTLYPGSKLFENAKQHNLIPEHVEGKWKIWDSSGNFIMQLPGITRKTWRSIKRKGKILQIKLLFKSGTFNCRSILIYFKRLANLL